MGWKPNGERCPSTRVREGVGILVSYSDFGDESKRENFTNDEKKKVVEKYTNGKTREEGYYKNGRKDGLWIYYRLGTAGLPPWSSSSQAQTACPVSNPPARAWSPPARADTRTPARGAPSSGGRVLVWCTACLLSFLPPPRASARPLPWKLPLASSLLPSLSFSLSSPSPDPFGAMVRRRASRRM